MDNELNMTKRHNLEAKKTSGVQGCTKSNTISRTGKVTFPFTQHW